MAAGNQSQLVRTVRGGIFRKAAQLVHAPYVGKINHADTKVWHYLLHRVYGEIGKTKFHRIPVAELMAFLGHSSPARLHESLQRLNDAEIRLEWTDEDDVPHSLRAHYISYDIAHSMDGNVTFAFDPFAIELLSNPTVFAQLSLSHMDAFGSIYATKLYEIMALRERREHRIWEPSVEEFRAQMAVESNYRRFDNLNQRVVIPALDEVNEVAPFGVILNYIRGGLGGKVVALRFETVPRDRRTLMDAASVPARRRGRNPDVPDLFDGRTDSERRVTVSAEALERAAEMVGSHFDPDEEVARWRLEMEGRRIRSPDRSFLNWLDLRLARGRADAGPDLDAVEQDALAGFLEAWEGGER